MKIDRNICTLIALSLVATLMGCAQAQTPVQASPAQQSLTRERNNASQRYETRQTFDGQVYKKDNNVWSYTREFAELFGMPIAFIEPIEGVAAAAFRIENEQYQECGYGGKADACRTVERCNIDLYFDEKKNPLPWGTDIQAQWYPWDSSAILLRALQESDKRFGILAVEPPASIRRHGLGYSQILSFANPNTQRQLIFTTNSGTDRGDKEDTSGAMALLGYTRNFYKELSIVSLQFSCSPSRKVAINIRLDDKQTIFAVPDMKFNRVELPEAYVLRIHAALSESKQRNALFFRNLLQAPATNLVVPSK
jgi:hypothetical protein